MSIHKSYPVMLNLAGKHCLVVGGGHVATRKVNGLLNAGAIVTVVSPDLTNELQSLVERQAIHLEQRLYRVGDVEFPELLEHWDGLPFRWKLVFAATSNHALNRAIVAEAETAGILVSSASEPLEADFFLPAVLNRGGLTLTVSASGTSPILAQRIRDELAGLFGPEYEILLAFLGKFRVHTLMHVADEDERRRLFAQVLDFDLLSAIRAGEVAWASKRSEIWLECFGTTNGGTTEPGTGEESADGE